MQTSWCTLSRRSRRARSHPSRTHQTYYTPPYPHKAPFPHTNQPLTNTYPSPGRKLDNLRLPERQHRLPQLHKLARRALQILLLVRSLRNRILRSQRLKLQHPSRGYGVWDYYVFQCADVVQCVADGRETVQGTAGAGSV